VARVLSSGVAASRPDSSFFSRPDPIVSCRSVPPPPPYRLSPADEAVAFALLESSSFVSPTRNPAGTELHLPSPPLFALAQHRCLPELFFLADRGLFLDQIRLPLSSAERVKTSLFSLLFLIVVVLYREMRDTVFRFF